MITTYKGVELPPGYFISQKTGGILRKKDAKPVNLDEFLNSVGEVGTTQAPPPPPEVSIKELMEFNRTVYDPSKKFNEFNSVLNTLLGRPILVSCCGVVECTLSNINNLFTLKSESFKSLEDQYFEFGKFFYCLMQDAWTKGTGNPLPGFTLKYTSYTSGENPFSKYGHYYMSSAYLFTHAAHQGIMYKDLFNALGVTGITIGHNSRYKYDSGHEITIYIIDRNNSMPKFFELHRERLTAEYLAAQTK